MVYSVKHYATVSDYTLSAIPLSIPLPLALGKLLILLSKQLNRLCLALESNTIAITVQPNIKGLVDFDGVGWVRESAIKVTLPFLQCLTIHTKSSQWQRF